MDKTRLQHFIPEYKQSLDKPTSESDCSSCSHIHYLSRKARHYINNVDHKALWVSEI